MLHTRSLYYVRTVWVLCVDVGKLCDDTVHACANSTSSHVSLTKECSLTIECVLLLQNVFSYYRMSPLLVMCVCGQCRC